MPDSIPGSGIRCRWPWLVCGDEPHCRLYALVEELRAAARRSRTARQLAAHFEVSVRTIERDLSALGSAAGCGSKLPPSARRPEELLPNTDIGLSRGLRRWVRPATLAGDPPQKGTS